MYAVVKECLHLAPFAAVFAFPVEQTPAEFAVYFRRTAARTVRIQRPLPAGYLIEAFIIEPHLPDSMRFGKIGVMPEKLRVLFELSVEFLNHPKSVFHTQLLKQYSALPIN